MAPLDTTSSVVTFSKTFTDDNPSRLVDFDVPFYDCNIHALTNNAKYGNGFVSDAPILAGDVVWFSNGNLKDFVFKNYTAGSNTQIIAVATVPNWVVKQAVK